MRNPEGRTSAHVVGAGFQPARPPHNPAAPATAYHPHAAKRPRCRHGRDEGGFQTRPYSERVVRPRNSEQLPSTIHYPLSTIHPPYCRIPTICLPGIASP